jgi:hypothetical protein
MVRTEDEKMSGGQYDNIIKNRDINLSNDSDAVLKILADLLNGLEGVVQQAKNDLAVIIQRIAEEKASAYVDFGFPKPLRKDAGFEKFLLKVLEAERSKHPGFTYQVRRNEQGEIVGVEIRGSKEHINHALKACAWIKGKLLSQNSKKGGAN